MSRELPGKTPQEGPEKLSQPLGTVIRDSKGILHVPFALRVVSFWSPSVFRERSSGCFRDTVGTRSTRAGSTLGWSFQDSAGAEYDGQLEPEKTQKKKRESQWGKKGATASGSSPPGNLPGAPLSCPQV